MTDAKPRKRSSDEVVWSGHPAIRAMVGFYLKLFFGSTAIVVLVFVSYKAGMINFILFLLLALLIWGGTGAWGYLERHMTKYTLTRRRATLQTGILNIRREQARLEKINNIVVEKDLIDRILRIGTVSVETANDSHGSTLRFHGVSNPGELERLIERMRNELYDRVAGRNKDDGESDGDLDLSFLD